MKKLFLLLTVFINLHIYSQTATKFVINGILFKFPKEVEFKNLNKNSGQYLFLDNKKSKIQISARDASKMEFYNSDFTESQLLEAFYKWDFDYWKNNSINAEIKEISKELQDKYILWEATVKEEKTIFLFGLFENKVISISVNNGNFSDTRNINFIMNIYKKIIKYQD